MFPIIRLSSVLLLALGGLAAFQVVPERRTYSEEERREIPTPFALAHSAVIASGAAAPEGVVYEFALADGRALAAEV